MTDSYEGGYTKALLDLYNFLSDHNDLIERCRSKRQLLSLFDSLLKLLLTNYNAKELFINYGGNVVFHVNLDKHAIEDITEV